MAFPLSIATTHANPHYLAWLLAVLLLVLSGGSASGSSLRRGQVLQVDSAGSRRQDIPLARDALGLWRTMPESGPKQDETAVQEMLTAARERGQLFETPYMPILLPDQKLFLCAPPKIDCSSLKMLMIRLIGVASPEDLCGYGWERMEQVVHQALPTYDGNPFWSREQANAFKHEFTQKQKEAWGYASSAYTSSEELLREAFLSREWTTIQVTRDPWYRAVSSYQDQIFRQHHNITEPSMAEDFLQFTLKRLGWGHHTGEQASICLNQYLKYDYVLKLEELDDGFQTLVRHGKIPKEAIYTGWENCTGHASLIQGPITINGEKHSASIKSGDVDSVFCNVRTTAAVQERYADDYKFLSDYGLTYPEPHQCNSNLR